jgi:hypothetical protein
MAKTQIEGGTVTCGVCKGKPPASLPQPRQEGISAAWDFLNRRLTGTPTVFEQSETRMVRVGGSARIEGADELLATPVFWDDEWVAVEQRQKEDPTFRIASATEEQEFDSVRKAAQAFQVDAAGPAALTERIRQAFGTGPVSQNVAQQVYVTDFANRFPESDLASSGPWVEIDAAGSLLRPCLAQLGQQFSTQRVALAAAGSAGVPLASPADLARLAESSSTVARIYYSVVDSKEDLLPQADRDVGLHQLTVRIHLVDFLDATGRVVKSTR